MHFGAKQDFARTYGWGHLIYKIMLCIVTFQIVNKSFKLCIVLSNNCSDEEQEMNALFKLAMMIFKFMMIMIMLMMMRMITMLMVFMAMMIMMMMMFMMMMVMIMIIIIMMIMMMMM